VPKGSRRKETYATLGLESGGDCRVCRHCCCRGGDGGASDSSGGIQVDGEGVNTEAPSIAEVDREGGGAPEGEGGGALDREGCDLRQGNDTLEVGAVGSLEIESIVLAEVVLRGRAEIVGGKNVEFVSVSACPALTAPKFIIEVKGSVGSVVFDCPTSTFGNINI
jgi:hypothetical protein